MTAEVYQILPIVQIIYAGRCAILTVFTKWNLSDVKNKRLSTVSVYLVDSMPIPPHILTRGLIGCFFEVFFAEVGQHRFSDALRPIVTR